MARQAGLPPGTARPQPEQMVSMARAIFADKKERKKSFWASPNIESSELLGKAAAGLPHSKGRVCNSVLDFVVTELNSAWKAL